jgi:hypothetical protein
MTRKEVLKKWFLTLVLSYSNLLNKINFTKIGI